MFVEKVFPLGNISINNLAEPIGKSFPSSKFPLEAAIFYWLLNSIPKMTLASWRELCLVFYFSLGKAVSVQ